TSWRAYVSTGAEHLIRRRRPASSLAAILMAVLAALIAITGCTSGKSAAPASSTPSGSVSSSPTTSAASGPSSATADNPTDSAAEQAIRTAYTSFLNPASSVDKSVSLLQDGEAFRSTLESATTESLAKSGSVTVSKVVLNSPDKATVTYSILLGGSPVIANTTGFAVREDGVWKVSGATFCSLLTLQGPLPAACSLPAATSTPS
ncbi:MAG: hypothetical protein JWO63_2127, partial [Frankiales bacterium]|nr:hypothetical protein [Frankiales bacterium]